MSDAATTVTTAEELVEATRTEGAKVVVDGEISGMPMITLAPGVSLHGGVLRFGARGVRMTTDNTLDDITVLTEDHEAAILNDTSASTLGTLTLRNVITRGQIAILADGQVRSGHVHAEKVHVAGADVRARFDRPHGFGVDALQGAFTLWNRQADPAVELTADLLDIAAGTEEAPVRGSGVFVAGHGDWEGQADGGVVRVGELRTGPVFSDGGIADGTPDLISGGVFVVTGAIVERVESVGEVITFGQNDMVLDNWGVVERWTASAPVTSHGPSGIGFVNFGRIGLLDVRAPIVTTGKGARGFNLYDGSLSEARFDSIATSGDGSVGIQISKPLGTLSVSGSVTTSGGEGLSLVKGVQVVLKAIALSVKHGGIVDSISIGGELATHGDHVATLEVDGTIKQLIVAGGIHANGDGAIGARVVDDGVQLDGLVITSERGEAVAR